MSKKKMQFLRKNSRIGIVNRGEAASRFLRAVEEYNSVHGTSLTTAALYTRADEDAPFVLKADYAVSLEDLALEGEDAEEYTSGNKAAGYLNKPLLIKALKTAECDALWVGWGFVSEDADFAEMTEREGFVFLGPDSKAMGLLGDKISAKDVAKRAKVPILPWSEGPVTSVSEAARVAEDIGYPVIVKASNAGGGRGIRFVWTPEELEEQFLSAREETVRVAGNDLVFMEHLVVQGRHLEVQCLADGYGNVLTLGVRDCSVQRRNQKIIEETPPPGLSWEFIQRIEEAASRLLKEAEYQSAGTVEFLYDTEKEEYYFMEVNTRLQVEHPITEELYQVDLVQGQIDVAFGKGLEEGVVEGDEKGWLKEPKGTVLEARLNAEDPDRDFTPAPGLISVLAFPTGAGIRIDSGVEQGSRIPGEFDSMIAKVIARGANRGEALARLVRALKGMRIGIEGGTTNRAFLVELLTRSGVASGAVHTKYVEAFIAEKKEVLAREEWGLALLVGAVDLYLHHEREALSQFHYQLASLGFPRSNPPTEGLEVSLSAQGISYTLQVKKTSLHRFLVIIDDAVIPLTYISHGLSTAGLILGGHRRDIQVIDRGDILQVEVDGVPYPLGRKTGGAVVSPSPAVVLGIGVSTGQEVKKGDRLMSLEAMKMEMVIDAPADGVVQEILISPGQQVGVGDLLINIEETGETDHAPADQPQLDFSSLLEDLRKRGEWDPDAQLMSVFLGYDLPRDAQSLVGRVMKEGSGRKGGSEFLSLCLRVMQTYVAVESLFTSREARTPRFAGRVTYQDLLFYLFRNPAEKGDDFPVNFLTRLEKAESLYSKGGSSSSAITARSRENVFYRLYKSHCLLGLKNSLLRSLFLEMEDQGIPEEMKNTLSQLFDEIIRLSRESVTQLADAAVYTRYRVVDRQRFSAMREASLAKFIQRFDELHGQISLKDSGVLALPTDSFGELAEELIDGGPSAVPFLVNTALSTVEKRWVAALGILGLRSIRDRKYEDGRIERGGGSPYCRLRSVEDKEARETIVTVVEAGGEGGGKKKALQLCLKSMEEIQASPNGGEVIVLIALGDSNEGEDQLEEEAAELFFQKLEEQFETFKVPAAKKTEYTIGLFSAYRSLGYRTYAVSEDPEERTMKEVLLKRHFNPLSFRELRVHRFVNFHVSLMSRENDVFVFFAESKENPRDQRLIALVDASEARPEITGKGKIARIPAFEYPFMEAVIKLRAEQSKRKRRLHWNRIIVNVRSLLGTRASQIKEYGMRMLPRTKDLGLEKMVVYTRRKRWSEDTVREIELMFQHISDDNFTLRSRKPSVKPLLPMDTYVSNVVRARHRGNVYPYEVIRMITYAGFPVGISVPRGEFEELDIEVDGEGNQRTVSVKGREYGLNTSNIVFGLISNNDGGRIYRRVVLLSDFTTDMGTLAEPECRRVIAALDAASERKIPVEWVPVSSGARIDMESGTENLDWTARALRRIVEFTQAGGEINVIVAGVNVGAQSYWNAESTMLMHTRGLLIMTDDAAMLLTGKKALDFSGSVSAEDNVGIGGVEKIMGPNGQAQIRAKSLTDAYSLLFKHYSYTYREGGDASPNWVETKDLRNRDIGESAYRDKLGQGFQKVGDIFSEKVNAERKKPFEMRQVMGAIIDSDGGYLERWSGVSEGETAIVWETRLGGYGTGLIGVESKPLGRLGRPPHDGPETFSGGTLYPHASKKVARAINSFSGALPLVVLANLSGFDGSPESLRKLQLEYGAEIGRAVVNFKGPICFVVTARYHGGAYVVFSKTLNPQFTSIALEGSFASVIGGAPAAAVVFPRQVARETEKDERVLKAKEDRRRGQISQREYDECYHQVYTEKQTALGKRFDSIHNIQRAKEVGSIDDIVTVSHLRPYLIDLLEREMGKGNRGE